MGDHSSYRAIRPLHKLGPAIAALFTVVVASMLVADSVNLFQLDLSVFRDAGGAFRRGLPLYSENFPSSSGFRFIYPPFAAMLFAPLTWLSPALLQFIWTLTNIVLVWWVLRLCLARLNVDRSSSVAVLILGPALLLEPIRSNFAFGQINIILMALVVSDCLRAVPRALRGAFIGLAAAVKLTPAGFGLFLLARRDTKAIATAAAVVLATVAAGFLLRPQDSKWFWMREFFRDDRAGGHEFHRNQAITGPLARLGLDGGLKDAVWLLAALTVAVIAFWAARRFARNGENVAALGVVALAALLAAPIAVTHHWVYCVILLPLLVAPQYRSWRPFLAVAVVVFLIGPHDVLEDAAPSGTWQQVGIGLVGNSQFLTAALLLIGAALAARRRVAEPEQTDLVAGEDAQLAGASR
ncbi:Polyprenol-phosphate-mannose-dependent alpha-(1-2)-phosphatidylinositol mannoside mannosyltransferase [Mycolicibacterium vanbaalenii]|uniref:Polyprenol-phosphate-mannose-dependent alpha-(1-2)-phosphatidylinositol mannoside mannosyltransferase n=1 Tax=Mycolicibacterium vanbaalenii TaxID=110539 RepID=A0A5S9R1P1_MYCVN|nr:glycosyltransferase family 87 protein [Mycolicibacterium vanbaalenii]CAA0127455.1 Polyprenol-phosphate-mannose-dependent alpha-(1-2)-phosphatidylinositol mannoside mannosyltransferase [Mycolicibacterium vanbaalenii]